MPSFFFLSAFKASVSKDCSDKRLRYCCLGGVYISLVAAVTVAYSLILVPLHFYKSNHVK